MYLLRRNDDGTFKRETFNIKGRTPCYAILSHRWTDDEPNFQDISNGTGQKKKGYAKLKFCAKQAHEDGLVYFWVDTVCINKDSSAELTEAINSMYRYYENATRCYAVLPDVEYKMKKDMSAFAHSVWWKRGWTLQELLAPKIVAFYGHDGSFWGTKESLGQEIRRITGIPISVLRGKPLSEFPPEMRMAWVTKRRTTLEEDRAYCLLGIFNVFLPVIYGEGNHAFQRLKDEIEKHSSESLARDKKKSLFRAQVQKNGRPEPYCFQELKQLSSDRLESTCSECGFCFRIDKPPTWHTQPLHKGRSMPRPWLWQRSHLQRQDDPSELQNPYLSSSLCFRCYLCGDDKLYNLEDMGRHWAKHSYAELTIYDNPELN